MEGERRAVRTVRVRNISDLAGEREVREFFSFSGEIEHVDIRCDGVVTGRTAYVTFKDPKALEIALLLSGATIVDRVVNITPAEDYIYIPVTDQQLVVSEVVSEVTSTAPNADLDQPTEANASPTTGRVYVSKAHDVMTTVIARGSAMRQDAVNKAKAFDEKHQLRANASAKINSFDKRVGISEKINSGITVVNEKVKSVDQRLHVSDKTMAALLAAERKLNDTGSAVKTNRYVSAGTSWLNGAFSKVAKAGHVAGSRTREKFQIAVSNLTAKKSNTTHAVMVPQIRTP
uniref:RRM domain-containing protein n=1 Tax=Oryza punctata TaxID=4537 RepID=A0A0E0KJ12_ORYPU